MIDLSEILPGLFMGSYTSPRNLANAAFRVAVYCASESQPKRQDGIMIIRCPLNDGRITDAEVRLAFATANTIARLIQIEKMSVPVTCSMGVNRSGLVTALAVRALTGCSGKEAVELVRQKRVFPRELRDFYADRGIAHALCNTSFVQWLEAQPALTGT